MKRTVGYNKLRVLRGKAKKGKMTGKKPTKFIEKPTLFADLEVRMLNSEREKPMSFGVSSSQLHTWAVPGLSKGKESQALLRWERRARLF